MRRWRPDGPAEVMPALPSQEFKGRETMKYLRQLRPPHPGFWVVLSVVTIAFGIGAQTLRAAPPGVARLKGPWQAALVWSGSGCGPMAGVVNFTLNQAGVDHKATL